MSDVRTQRRRSTIASESQLAVLKKVQSVSGNPTEDQLSAAAAETGLDEKWVRNWFTRQRSKLAARSARSQLAAAAVPTFKLQLSPPSAPSDLAASTPASPRRQSATTFESRSPRSTVHVNTETVPRSHRSVFAPVYSINPPNTASSSHTTATLTYSRDPLCNRYPDFSQFFRPRGHERLHSFELSAPIDVHHRLTHSNTPRHPQGLSSLLNPLQLGGLPTDLFSSAYPQPCPVAFSMRLVDLLGHP